MEQDKHSEILNQIAGLFMSYGIRNVSMDNISQQLGISKKTLYQWFSSKEVLIDKVIDRMISNVSDKPHCAEFEKSAETAIDVILGVMKILGELSKSLNPIFFWELNKYFPVQAKKLNDFRVNHIKNKIIENLKRGISEGIYRKNINIDIVAQLYVSWIENFPTIIHKPELTSYSTDKILEEIYCFHLHAIVNNKGREILKQRFDSDYEI